MSVLPNQEEIEKMGYKDALKLLMKILDEQGKQIASLDERERLIQKTLERLMGQLEGAKEAKKEFGEDWKWKAGFLFGVVVLAIEILIKVWEAIPK